jgi:hypothetical protein
LRARLGGRKIKPEAGVLVEGGGAMTRAPLVLVGCLLVGVFALSGTAAAHGKPGGGGGDGSRPNGYDISYPQCGNPFPTNVLFGIVGVNDGIVYSPNPCLGTGDGASELAWALRPGTPGLYANTADPGPALSSHWPRGQTSPVVCDPSQPDSTACSYDYGWNAAANSYQDAATAYIQLGLTGSPAASPWWLDVETANSWESNTANNVNALQGELDYLTTNAGVASVGFYVNAADWAAITGSTTAFASDPYWRPGAADKTTAQSFCGTTGPTGHLVTLSQYSSGRYDADIRC